LTARQALRLFRLVQNTVNPPKADPIADPP
jgi:hypothetical protein